MTWAQTVVIVVPILVAIVGGLFYGNRQFEQLGLRIDDLRNDMNAGFAAVDTRFAAVDARFAEIHAEMHTHLGELRTEMHAGFGELRTEMHAGFGELHQDLREMRGLLQASLQHKAS